MTAISVEIGSVADLGRRLLNDANDPERTFSS